VVDNCAVGLEHVIVLETVIEGLMIVPLVVTVVVTTVEATGQVVFEITQVYTPGAVPMAVLLVVGPVKPGPLQLYVFTGVILVLAVRLTVEVEQPSVPDTTALAV
jgi:hypothetical protein